MKNISPLVGLKLLLVLFLASCSTDDDELTRNPTPTTIDFSQVEVQDFIWKGLNIYYLWKDEVSLLSDDQDDVPENYFNLLNSNSPEPFFQSLLHPADKERSFSWMVEDYIALENSFSGISKSNGVVYRLAQQTGDPSKILGYVRYILPDSDAVGKDIKRGDVFYAVDGVDLTLNNYSQLLSSDSYTLSMAELNAGDPIPNGKEVSLTKSEYQENPVYISKVIEQAGMKIGYLMYNRFNGEFDQELNAAVGELKAEGVSELILDLRYNPGGSVRTSTYLASMITGQFKDELYAKERWNNLLQNWFEDNHPDWIVNKFTDRMYKTNADGSVDVDEQINHLNLSNLYVITTGSTASSSELIINGLNPYINVTTIGTKTVGKYVGSITLYDSENFTRAEANPNHTYAMQPIVLETVNRVGVNAPNGFAPDIEQIEYVSQFEELGNPNEPLLALALQAVTGSSKVSTEKDRLQKIDLKHLPEPEFKGGLLIEKELPEDLLKRN